VALLTLVLLAAFFLKNDDLVAESVPNDSRLYASGRGLAARKDRIDIDFLACFGVDGRNTYRLPAFDRELLTAGFNDRITHFLSLDFRAALRANFCPTAEKVKLYGKGMARSSLSGVLYNADEREVSVTSGGIESVAHNKLVRDDKPCVIKL